MKRTAVRSFPAPRQRRETGFTLLELMIVVAIVGILAAIALPNYSDYVTRGRINEATTGLENFRQLYEQYFLDNRSYVGACAAYQGQIQAQILSTNGTKDFTINCGGAGNSFETTSTYQIEAAGTAGGVMANFDYTIDNTGAKASSGGAWGSAPTCWLIRKGGSCT